MARPRKYTDEQLIAALRATKGMVYLAAAKVGCDPDTFYERAKSSPAIAAAMRTERGKVLDTAEQKLFEAVKKCQPWAVMFALKMLGKERGYTERPQDLPPLELLLAALPENISAFVRKALADALRSGGDPGGGAVGPGLSLPA